MMSLVEYNDVARFGGIQGRSELKKLCDAPTATIPLYRRCSQTIVQVLSRLKLIGGIVSRADCEGYSGLSVFNDTNENIEWAAWSWNPVTGCQHGCDYCYAEDIANRFYPHKFEPTFHPDRLTAPQNTKIGTPRWHSDSGYKGVFVGSMADLFGNWVPQEWIDAVLNAVRGAPQWTFIFLTKNH